MIRAGIPAGAVAMLLAVVAGAAGSLQAYVNGQLGRDIGSAHLAAVANLTVGIILVLTVTVVSRAGRRALQRWRASGGMRAWYLLGGVAGAAYVLVMAEGAPRVGVALLTVGVVAGQVAGGLVIDRAGLSPAGRRSITPARVLALFVAVGAVALSAGPSPATFHVGLVLAAVGVGIGLALQSAANGHISRLTREPIVAAAVNFTVGFACLVTAAIVFTGTAPPNGWDAPAWEWTGGLFGAFAVTIIAAVVARLGVLRMMLAVVAGQALAALAIDLLAPARGAEVTATTVAGVVLALVAVLLIERDALRLARSRSLPSM